MGNVRQRQHGRMQRADDRGVVEQVVRRQNRAGGGVEAVEHLKQNDSCAFVGHGLPSCA